MQSLIRWKKLLGFGKGDVTRYVLNSADFMASYKIYTVKNWFMLSVRILSYGCTQEVWRA